MSYLLGIQNCLSVLYLAVIRFGGLRQDAVWQCMGSCAVPIPG